MKLYQAIAQNARPLDDPAFSKHAEIRQERIVGLLPSGSGFDSGTRIINASDSLIVFETEFHHMNENGYYDGWTSHRVTVRPSFMHGLVVSVSGRNRNNIKGYISDVFSSVLDTEFEWMN